MTKRRTAPWWEKFKVDVPRGQVGDWAVETFRVSYDEAKWHQLTMLFNGAGSRGIFPGTYTRLTHNQRVVMSDTPAEIKDHLEIIRMAEGQVLLNGLGLGLVLRACLLKSEVDHVTVIEIAPEVIELVEPHWHRWFGDRFTVHQADALTWKPPKNTRYDVCWHDIWDELCSENLPEMHKLHRRYGHRCDWQGSWSRAEVEYRQRQERFY